MSNNSRIGYIDVAKGLCMVLVVWVHTHTYYLNLEVGTHWMESFIIPLFFLISGMFFKKYENFGVFMIKKTNTIIVPFLFFYLIFSFSIPNILNLLGYDGLRQASKLGWASLFNCIFEKTYSNSPVWFLLALFWLDLLFYSIFVISGKYAKNYQKTMIVLLSVICGLCGFFLGVNRVFVWANIDNALTACPFFCFGYFLNQTKIISTPPKSKYLILIIVFGVVFTLLFSHGLSFKQNKWAIGDLFSLYSCGAIGSLAVIALSKIVEKSQLLKFYGKNTLIILCIQMPLIQAVNILIRKIGMNQMGEFILTFILVIMALCVVTPFIDKYLPWFTGKRNLI